ncbi:MAG: hypothetical protein GY853_02135, partial [PVC group bacterium]|nr:hypothetical protein [PVC group bacterium]
FRTMSKVRKTVQGLKERIKKNKASAVVIDGQTDKQYGQTDKKDKKDKHIEVIDL